MNKVSLLVLALALSSCTSTPDTKWTDDCAKHHSFDSREFALCKKRLESKKQASEASVSLDPQSVNVPTEDEMKKTRAD